MLKAIKIKMKKDCYNSKNIQEIKDIQLDNGISKPSWFSKESIHDNIKYNGTTIIVNIYPYPKLIPVTFQNEKYVKSYPNGYENDNLLMLPRE